MGPETFVDARVQSVVYQIGAEAPEALLDVLDALARIADGEEVTAQEATRILGESIDFSRQAQAMALRLRAPAAPSTEGLPMEPIRGVTARDRGSDD